MPTLQFCLKTEEIDLVQLLKAARIVHTGGNAKLLIQDGDVLLNGEVETRARKKVRAGDVVEFRGYRVEVIGLEAGA